MNIKLKRQRIFTVMTEVSRYQPPNPVQENNQEVSDGGKVNPHHAFACGVHISEQPGMSNQYAGEAFI